MNAQGPVDHFAVWDRSQFRTIVLSTRIKNRPCFSSLEFADPPPATFAGFKIVEDRSLPQGICELRNLGGERLDRVRFM